jgi:hypothetical protein
MGLIAASYLLALIAVVRLIATLSKSPLKWYFDPMVLFSSLWIFGYLLYASPIFTVRESITYEATLYVMSAHTVFFVGSLLPEFFSRESAKLSIYAPRSGAATNPPRVSFRLLVVIGLVGLVGLCSVLIDGILTSSIGLGDRLSGGALNEVRTETFARAQGLEAQGPLVRLNQFAAAAFLFIGLLLNLPLAGFSPVKRNVLVGAGVISALLIVFNQLFIRSGRMDIVVLLLFVAFAVSLGPVSAARAALLGFVRRYRVVVVTLGLPAVLGLFYLLGVVFVQGRSGGVSALYSLYAYHRMGLTAATETVVAGSALLETAVLSLSYFVTPLTTHSFYFSLSDSAFSGPYWGQYNFQYLTATLFRYSGFGADWEFFWSIRNKVWAPLAALGYGTNVWATLLRDLAIDFGWTGTLISVFFLGVGSKWMAIKAISGRYPALVVAYSFTAVFLVFSFAISMFYVTSVFPPFMYAIVLYAFLASRGSFKPKPMQAYRTRPTASR